MMNYAKERSYKYKFSVIIPIYNSEAYLRESIESILNQTIGFQESIQLILVHDGSEDNSEIICKEYQKMYPENIIYLWQENAGVSAARNTGLEYVEGEVVNFLDADDKWETDVFAKVWTMFSENEGVDVVCVRMKFFEALDRYHRLDYKFDRDKVIDIFEDFDHIQLSVSSGFMRESAIGKLRFDSRVRYSEDAKFVYELVLKKEKLGIIASSLYLYRKRSAGDSAIQSKHNNADWYLVTPELCYKYTFDLSREKYGRVIPFVQYYVAYDYQWRIKEFHGEALTQQEKDTYLKITKKLFDDIDIETILKLHYATREYKLALISIKAGKDIRSQLEYDGEILSYDGIELFGYYFRKTLVVTDIDIDKKNLTITGEINTFLPASEYKICARTDIKEEQIELHNTNKNEKKLFDVVFNCDKNFTYSINEKSFKKLEFVLVYREKYETVLPWNIDDKIDFNKRIYQYKDKCLHVKKGLRGLF